MICPENETISRRLVWGLRRLTLLAALALVSAAAVTPAHAQLGVDIQIKRRTFIRYEPIIATVSVTNLSGRDLVLRDGSSQWFGFQVNAGSSENLVPPRNPDYHLDPLELKAGASAKRSVNLNSLFPISEFGPYRIRATIYSEQLDKYFSSRALNIEVTDGTLIWQQTVGVPEGLANGGAMHNFALLKYQSPDKRYLYCRIEDRAGGVVFGTYQLGHMIDGPTPEVHFDSANNLYVLHLVGPKTYLLSKVGVNGEFLGQTTYLAGKTRPYLRRLANGTLQIVGGRREVAQNTASQVAPAKLSDRPAGLPLN